MTKPTEEMYNAAYLAFANCASTSIRLFTANHKHIMSITAREAVEAVWKVHIDQRHKSAYGGRND